MALENKKCINANFVRNTEYLQTIFFTPVSSYINFEDIHDSCAISIFLKITLNISRDFILKKAVY